MNDFEIMNEMAETDKDIRSASNKYVSSINIKKKSSQITITLEAEVGQKISSGEFLCVFYAMDKKQFLEIQERENK